jgi:succinoglycan biosynthesis protein ExoL
MIVLYLAHDLGDAAVGRRVRMLQAAGASVRLAGFRRAQEPPSEVEGVPAVDLGRTADGRFLDRAARVAFAAIRLHRLGLERGVDVIMARNMEMLALAVRLRRRSPGPLPIVYEALDIHRLLLAPGPVGAAFRQVEGWLARQADLLFTSSPAFLSRYFEPMSHVRLPVMLIENKVLRLGEGGAERVRPRMGGPPWRIGWFGALRCRRSFDALAALARGGQGMVEVVLRGRPAYRELPDFDAVVASTPHLTYGGPYRNPDDLEAIHRDVHFTWAIDCFEQGGNSDWLLPNRIYEGPLHGAVPIAFAHVETGRFLERLGVGVLLTEPLEAAARQFLASLDTARFAELAAAIDAVPETTWSCGREECALIVSRMRTLLPAAAMEPVA